MMDVYSWAAKHTGNNGSRQDLEAFYLPPLNWIKKKIVGKNPDCYKINPIKFVIYLDHPG